MTLKEAMQDCFRDQPHRGTARKWFHSKEAAEVFAKTQENFGTPYGIVYGPYVGFSGEQDWYEVTYKIKY